MDSINHTKQHLGPLLAEGRTAQVFAWEDGKIIKLMRPGFSSESLGRECQLALKVQGAGLPAPYCYGLVQVDGLTGLVYQRVGPRSLGDVIRAKPWRAGWAARTQARLQVQNHQRSMDGLLDLRAAVQNAVEHSAVLDERVRKAVLDRLANLPVGDRVCHLDFHPWNVMQAGQGWTVIDWANVRLGDPCADVARSLLLIYVTEQMKPAWVMRLLVRWFYAAYQREYIRLTGVDWQKVLDWLPVMAAARTSEGIADQQEQLIALAKTLLVH